MIPLKDINPTRTTPVVNIALIVANVLVFFYMVYTSTLVRGSENAIIMAYGTVPARLNLWLAGRIPAEAALLPLVTSMFLHSGLMHLAGNMLFLWVFGDNVEDYFGHFPYLLFYLACGIGSGLTHILFNFHSPLPALGASGAISGVMGAYIILYPRARVLTLVFIFFIPIPAFIILGYWFFLQFLAGVSSVGAAATGGVAWWAHVGGFLLGMLITGLSLGGRKQSVNYS
jgi:membrane associated rhomboid family serine protease